MLTARRAGRLWSANTARTVWSPPTAICQGAFAESSLQGARRYAQSSSYLYPGSRQEQAQLLLRRPLTTSSIARAKPAEALRKREKLDMADFPLDRIRNLSIIAHIDHGKSTLADRLLQLTGTVPADANAQFLDKLKVERERGITVKAQTVSLIHRHTDGHEYLINLIDTPGHVDFSYEVSRSLGACEGGLLLVDCSQGIQAQTLSVYHHAVDADLTLLPVINKVDLPHADPVAASREIASSLGLPEETHMRISAKSGLGVENVLGNIVDNLPPPEEWVGEDGRLRGLVFDTFYDHFRGVVSLVRLFSGSVKKGDKVKFLQAGKKYEVLEVGVYNPEEIPVDELYSGQVGYVVCNMKNSDEAHIGDTICLADKPVDALPGFKPMKAMVYAGVFPVDSNEFTRLEEAIERLTLNDRSVSVQRESSAALSQGFRLGFLGTLHMDVFRQRLEDEYESSVIITSPTVPFKVVYKDGREEFISNPAEFPDTTDPKMRVAHIEEPMVNATIFVPNSYIGQMMTLCSKYRGQQVEYKVLDASDRAVLRYTLPLSEIVTDFFSELKSESSGFASFDYEEAGYEQSDLVKLNMMLNSKPVDALAMIVHRDAAQTTGRMWTKKLRAVLPRQLFEVAIQAAVGSKVLARETLSAMRKDVTAGLYGGHYERKMKHLEKQKKGKLRLKKLAGNIDVPQSAFFEVLSSRPRGFSTCARAQSAIRSDIRTYGSGTATAGIAHLLRHNVPSGSGEAENEPMAGTALVSTPEPILPPALHPRTRSTLLSNILRLADSPTATASSIYTAWTELYLASPASHAFSPVELVAVIKALHKAHQNERTFAPVAKERSGIVEAELSQIRSRAPESARADSRDNWVRNDLELMADYSRLGQRRQRISKAKVEEEERYVQRRYPVPPIHDRASAVPQSKTLRGKRREYALLTNGLMYLAANAQEESTFERWWTNRVAAEFRPDSFTVLARMTLLARQGRTEDMKATWQEVAAETSRHEADRQDTRLEAYKPDIDWGSPLPLDDATGSILINVLLWTLAKQGEWADVAGVYDQLRRHDTHSQATDDGTSRQRIPFDPSCFMGASGGNTASIHVPANIVASSETFSLLIRALSYQGDLPGSLDVMRHMFAAGHVPGVPEYCSLFEGFARWGQVGSVDMDDGRGRRWKGDLDAWMPVPRIYTCTPLKQSGAQQGQGLASIWNRNQAGQDAIHRPSIQLDDAANVWAEEALETLFDSFLSILPAPDRPRTAWSGRRSKVNNPASRAPAPEEVWTILLAFNRTSGGDGQVVRDAYSRLHAKFGDMDRLQDGEAADQWHGWRLDGRLERTLQALRSLQ